MTVRPTLVPRPGAGFVLLAATLGATLAFVGWGLRAPPLERLGELTRRLFGEGPPLDDDELATMQQALARHPRLARDLIDGAEAGMIGDDGQGAIEGGRAYVVRLRAGDGARLEVEGDGDIDVSLRTLGAHTRGQVRPGTPLVWRPPAVGPYPQLIEIRVLGAAGVRPAAPVVRVRLRGTP